MGLRFACASAPCLLVVLLGAIALPSRRAHAEELPPVPVRITVDPADETQSLRERLTEREDKRRPLVPWSVDLAGRPLTIGGEYEATSLGIRRQVLGGRSDQRDRAWVEQDLEVETFYSFGEPLSIFAQLRLGLEEELLPDVEDDVSDVFVERGELWLASEHVGGTPVGIDVGRLHFEDDRRWWWDEDLDAARATVELGEAAELSFAVARELLPERSDLDRVAPADDRVLRLLGQATWDWRHDHRLELFVLHADDRSPTERVDDAVRAVREDGSDARLTWLGARAMGALDYGDRGVLGYWLDAAWVGGEEDALAYEESEETSAILVVTERTHRDVRGWAFDAGLNWMLAAAHEPRLFAGVAVGSADSDPDARTDRAFRQTGLETNEAGYGGVERFSHYGLLLAPELSNLVVTTAGVGIALFRSSSLDLVHHHYAQLEESPLLRDAGLDAALTGSSRDVGDEIDLVLAIEEWERFELELAGAVFRAGDALGRDQGRVSFGGFLSARFAF